MHTSKLLFTILVLMIHLCLPSQLRNFAYAEALTTSDSGTFEDPKLKNKLEEINKFEKIHDRKAINGIFKKNPNKTVKAYAALALGRLADESVVPYLVELVSLGHLTFLSAVRSQGWEQERLREAYSLAVGVIKSLGAKAIPRLTETVVNRQEESLIRSTALRILVDLESKKSIPLLIELLQDGERDIRHAATLHLATLEQYTELIKIVVDKKQLKDIRWEAAQSLAHSHNLDLIFPIADFLNKVDKETDKILDWIVDNLIVEEKDLLWLVRLLDHTEAKVRLYVLDELVEELGYISQDKSGERKRRNFLNEVVTDKILKEEISCRIKKCLQDNEQEVRIKTISTLGILGDISAGPEIVKVLREQENDQIRIAAIWSLKQMDYKPAVEEIVKLIDSNNYGIAKEAIEVIGDWKENIDTSVIIESLGNPYLRYKAIQALGKLGDKRAGPYLADFLKDKDDNIRTVSLEALIGLKDGRYYNEVVNSLKDTNPSVRAAAAQALGSFKNKEAAHYLIKTLKDESPQVRGSSVWALGELRDKNAISHLIPLLEDKDFMWGTLPDSGNNIPPVFIVAVESLEKITGKKVQEEGPGWDGIVKGWQKWWTLNKSGY